MKAIFNSIGNVQLRIIQNYFIIGDKLLQRFLILFEKLLNIVLKNPIILYTNHLSKGNLFSCKLPHAFLKLFTREFTSFDPPIFPFSLASFLALVIIRFPEEIIDL